MKSNSELQNQLQMIKVSKLYYQQNLSKVEIGKNLRLSRFKIARLLEDAVNMGVVTINIKEPENSYIDVENELETKFNIYRAHVVDTVSSYNATKRNLGIAAAKCLTEMVRDGDAIGIAWGSTLFEMVNALPESVDRKNVSVVQLTGGLNQVETKYNAIELSSKLSKIFKADCYPLYAPAIVDSIDTKKLLFNDSSIRRTIDMFCNVNIAVIGIGSVQPTPSSLLYKEGFLVEDDLETLSECNAVGDINTCFFDANGNSCNSDFAMRAVGMDIDQLKRLRYVVGVAGGEFKTDSIYAALKGKIINILVTDSATARLLLKK